MEEEPQKSCQDLEDGPCAQLTHLFHALYRTGKRDSGGLNPFRDEFEMNGEKHFDGAAMTMIREIKKNVFDKGKLSILSLLYGMMMLLGQWLIIV